MRDEWIIRGTAWLAFALYVAAEAKRSRWLSAFGCAVLLCHIAAAFQFKYGWSETAAYSETARQTAAVTGWNWGGGIYVNYAFALIWIWMVARWRICDGGWAIWIQRSLFLFMFLNAGVIFVHGPMRWFGLAGCVALIFVWLMPTTGNSLIKR